MRDDRLYLIHIAECIERVLEYVHGGRADFIASHMVQDAVIRNLQTMAESTQRLGEAVKSATPQIDWTGVAGFRNILVHDYLGIDLDRVWEIVESKLPELLTAVRGLLDG